MPLICYNILSMLLAISVPGGLNDDRTVIVILSLVLLSFLLSGLSKLYKWRRLYRFAFCLAIALFVFSCLVTYRRFMEGC